jgi:hypothetical protein
MPSKAGGRASYDLGDCEKSIELSASAGRLTDEIHAANYPHLALSLSGKSYLAPGQYEPARTNVEHASRAAALQSAPAAREQIA